MPRRWALRTLIGAAAADVMMFVGMPAASADAIPRVYTRRDWGATPARRRPRLLSDPPDRIVVHHTASPNTRNTSRAHAFALSRWIQRYHMQSRGWDDIGEQLTISRGGHVMEGRRGTLPAIRDGRMVMGAHSLRHNDHTIGIENEGTYMTEDVPDRLWTSLVDVCAWLCMSFELDPAVAIIGHRDYNHTECPGDVLYRRLPRLRAEVGRVLGDEDTRPPDPPSDERRRITSRRRHRIKRH